MTSLKERRSQGICECRIVLRACARWPSVDCIFEVRDRLAVRLTLSERPSLRIGSIRIFALASQSVVAFALVRGARDSPPNTVQTPSTYVHVRAARSVYVHRAMLCSRRLWC